jgi:hypothetical protein
MDLLQEKMDKLAIVKATSILIMDIVPSSVSFFLILYIQTKTASTINSPEAITATTTPTIRPVLLLLLLLGSSFDTVGIKSENCPIIRTSKEQKKKRQQHTFPFLFLESQL